MTISEILSNYGERAGECVYVTLPLSPSSAALGARCWHVVDLLLKQQEEGARASESAISSLGLLTMISDYDAQLYWRFDIHPTQPGSMTVTTSAVLPLENVSGASA